MLKLPCIYLLLLILIGNNAFPQELRSYGLKLAITSSDQQRDYSQLNIDTKRRVGINCCIYAEWFDHPFISVLTQLEYNQKGFGDEWAFTNELGPENAVIKILYDRLDYVSIPVLVKITLTGSRVEPFAYFGPRIDYFIGGSYDRPFASQLYDNYKKSVLGGTVGVGLGTRQFLHSYCALELRYNYDLTYSYNTEFLKVKNNSMDIWVVITL